MWHHIGEHKRWRPQSEHPKEGVSCTFCSVHGRQHPAPNADPPTNPLAPQAEGHRETGLCWQGAQAARDVDGWGTVLC